MPSINLRFRSPAQLAVLGIILVLLGWFGLLAPLHSALLYAGVLSLVVAGIAWMIRPQRRTVVWRGRVIDMTGELTWWERLYYVMFRE